MHLENAGSKIYRGLVESVGMKKSAGECIENLIISLLSGNDHCSWYRYMNYSTKTRRTWPQRKFGFRLLRLTLNIAFFCGPEDFTLSDMFSVFNEYKDSASDIRKHWNQRKGWLLGDQASILKTCFARATPAKLCDNGILIHQPSWRTPPTLRGGTRS